MTTMKSIQINLCVTEPLQQALQAAASELCSPSDYARRALVMVLRAEGYHIPAATHGDDADGRGIA
jgi:hypothetical protein